MSKMHETAGQDQRNQMLLEVARMENELAEKMDMSIPSAVVAIQQMTASHLAMWDRVSAATLLRETARLLTEEITEDEFARRITPVFDVLAAEFERQSGADSQ